MQKHLILCLALVPVALTLTIDVSKKGGSAFLKVQPVGSIVNSTLAQMSIAAKADNQPKARSLEADVPQIMDQDELKGNHALDSIRSVALHIIVPGAFVFMLSMACGHVLTLWKYASWVPESATTLAVALILGKGMKYLAEHNSSWSDEGFVLGASTTLNLVLLPIIIFASGWGLRRADFIYQFNPIIIFAVFGTLISTFVIGFSSYALSNYFGLHIVTDLRSNMAFAALISAVDPVATLCTYKALNVEPLLNIMVFGESTINDAVAVVIFTIINERWHSLDYLRATGRITQLLFGSMAFGLLVAGLLILIMRITKMNKNRYTGILFIFMSAYFVYGSAEASGMFSGIIASLLAGILFGAYGRLHLDTEGSDEADVFFELACQLADKAVFVLCGASTAMITSNRGLLFGAISVGLCYFGRACSVVPCGCAANALKRAVGDQHILTWNHLFMMWHGGLRGGIALVLALEIDGTWCHYKATIVNGTFITICVLLVVNGGSTEMCLKYFHIETGCTDSKWDCLKPAQRGTAQNTLKRIDSILKSMLSNEKVDDEEKTTMLTNSDMHVFGFLKPDEKNAKKQHSIRDHVRRASTAVAHHGRASWFGLNSSEAWHRSPSEEWKPQLDALSEET